MKKIIENIDKKVNKLISLYKSVSQENKKIYSENDKLKQDIKERELRIQELKEKIKLVRITKSVNSEKSENIKESRKKINEYVREIDKCVALLNK